MNQDIFNQVREIAADLLAADVATLTPDSAPETLEAWDSVQHLNLVLAVESRFGLQFDPEEVDQMKSLGAIACVVDAKQGPTVFS
jgi:acyl carrier protein